MIEIPLREKYLVGFKSRNRRPGNGDSTKRHPNRKKVGRVGQWTPEAVLVMDGKGHTHMEKIGAAQ